MPAISEFVHKRDIAKNIAYMLRVEFTLDLMNRMLLLSVTDLREIEDKMRTVGLENYNVVISNASNKHE